MELHKKIIRSSAIASILLLLFRKHVLKHAVLFLYSFLTGIKLLVAQEAMYGVLV